MSTAELIEERIRLGLQRVPPADVSALQSLLDCPGLPERLDQEAAEQPPLSSEQLSRIRAALHGIDPAAA